MPISQHMSTFELMEIMYREIERIENSREARKVLSNIFNIVLHEIEDEGVQFTADELEKRLQPCLKDFIEAAKKTNVA
jgi:transposase